MLFLSALEIAFLARAIMSWFTDESNKILYFLIALTEPVIFPVRALCEKFGWFEGLPLDIPFILTYVIISMLGALLVF